MATEKDLQFAGRQNTGNTRGNYCGYDEDDDDVEPLDEGYDALPSKSGHLPPGSAIYFNNQSSKMSSPGWGKDRTSAIPKPSTVFLHGGCTAHEQATYSDCLFCCVQRVLPQQKENRPPFGHGCCASDRNRLAHGSA